MAGGADQELQEHPGHSQRMKLPCPPPLLPWRAPPLQRGWRNATYKLLSFTDSAFFFMNHAGSASGLTVCKTTNQEKFDLTQAGNFPSITRRKCWSSRERHRAGDSPRGTGAGQEAWPGLSKALGWVGDTLRLHQYQVLRQQEFPGFSISTPPTSSQAPLGPPGHLDESYPSYLALPAPAYRTSYSSLNNHVPLYLLSSPMLFPLPQTTAFPSKT